MIRGAALTFLLTLTVFGCRTAENVASTSAAFITAPAHYVSRKLGGEQTETTDTTVYENQPVVTTPPPPQPTPARSPGTITSTTTTASSPPQQNETHPSTSATSHAGVTPQSSSTNSAAQFPVAKPVPGKPGYVFSPYDPNGGYVDVSGYPSGSKVKDPYSQKIFLVP